MANGVLEVTAGWPPKNEREAAAFFRKINELIKVQGDPSSLVLTIGDNSVTLGKIEAVSAGSILGRTGSPGNVQQLSGSQAAGLIQGSIDHGSIAGLGDDDHTQYVLKTTLTANGDLLIRLAGNVSRLATGTAGQVLGITSSLPAWVTPDATYTPTLTGVANVASSAAFLAQYTRLGNTINVSGKLDVTATAGATLTQIGISLPVASNFANQQECGGTAAAVAVVQSGGIAADATNDRAQLSFISADTTVRSMMFTFQYRVL